MLNEAILDALIGINQTETQTRLEWQSVMLVSSLPKLGNESRLYKNCTRSSSRSTDF